MIRIFTGKGQLWATKPCRKKQVLLKNYILITLYVCKYKYNILNIWKYLYQFFFSESDTVLAWVQLYKDYFHWIVGHFFRVPDLICPEGYPQSIPSILLHCLQHDIWSKDKVWKNLGFSCQFHKIFQECEILKLYFASWSYIL